MAPNSSIVNVLNTVFQETLSEEINREATLLSLITKRPERKATVQWNVNVGGAKAQGVSVTANSPEASRDLTIPATLPIHYSSLQTSITINEKEVKEAAVQVSEPELIDLLKSNVSSNVEEMQRALNEYLFIGTGGVNQGGIYGLQLAVSEEDYAGISATDYPLWRATVIDLGLDNNGNYADVDNWKALNIGSMFDMEQFIRTKGGRYDLILTSPKVMTQYKRLFATERTFYHVVGDQRIPLIDLGFGVGGFGGVPIIDDPHCFRTRSKQEREAIAAASAEFASWQDVPEIDEGVIYFLKQSDLEFLSTPTDNTKMITNGVFTQMERLAKQKLYVSNYVAGCIPQMKLKSRKNVGRIQNIELETGVVL